MRVVRKGRELLPASTSSSTASQSALLSTASPFLLTYSRASHLQHLCPSSPTTNVVCNIDGGGRPPSPVAARPPATLRLILLAAAPARPRARGQRRRRRAKLFLGQRVGGGRRWICHLMCNLLTTVVMERRGDFKLS